MTENNQKIGYLKYSGSSVDEGAFDMKKSAEALLGFDEMLRYFVSKEEPLLSNAKFDIPVNIRKGSWEISLMEGIFGIGAVTYLTSVAKTAGKDGLLETGPVKDVKKIFIGAFEAIKWVIKIRSHRKDKIKKLEHLQFKDNNNTIGIPNAKGEYLYVPKKYYDLYTEFPEKIFFKNTKLIESNRILEIGNIEPSGKISDIKITENEKIYFYEEEKEDNIILPELVHGEHVELEGEITRTNENTNTIGFRYNGHVLMCKPLYKSLTYFKDKIVSNNESHFFSKVKMIGVVNRIDNEGEYKDKKPMIYFTDIQKIEKIEDNRKLF